MEPWHTTVDIDAGQLDVLLWNPHDAVRSTATGRTVIALHGFPQTAWEWSPVAEVLAAEGIRTVAPTQRGYSPAARPTGVADYAIEHLGADVLAVADHFGLDRIHVLGHDWGASVAWWLAAHHPDRVESLTALSVPHLAAFGDAVATDPEQQRRSAYFGLFRQEGEAEDILLDADPRHLGAVFGDEASGLEVAERVAELDGRAGLTGALNWYRAMRRYDLPEVVVPTTFLWGEGDWAIARSGAAATSTHVVGDYRFVPVSGAGHWLPEQFPDLVADETLARIGAGSD